MVENRSSEQRIQMILTSHKSIRVYRNGDIHTPPSHITLTQHQQASMWYVLKGISDRSNFAVRRLFTLSGQPVEAPAQIQNNGVYVAARGVNERYVRANYGLPLEPLHIPRNVHRQGAPATNR